MRFCYALYLVENNFYSAINVHYSRQPIPLDVMVVVMIGCDCCNGGRNTVYMYMVHFLV